MSITVHVSWLENHKPGRNAYYQVFQFVPVAPDEPKGSRIVTLTHWGPIKYGVSKWHRPVESGQTKVESGALLPLKVAAKGKRGYMEVDTRAFRMDNDHAWMVEELGATLAHEVKVCMGLMGEGSAALGPTDDPENSIMGSAIAEPDTRPANWGAW